MQRAIRTVEIMAAVRHPNICRVYAYSEVTPSLLFIAFHLGREDLRTFLTNNELSRSRKLQYARQVTLAVHQLHSLHIPILHRDLKATNLVMDENNNVMLIDFGFANFATPNTHTGGGTAQWQAPETLTPKPLWSTKSDIYSLGMVIWEILTGEIPFPEYCNNSFDLKEQLDAGIRPRLPAYRDKVCCFKVVIFS